MSNDKRHSSFENRKNDRRNSAESKSAEKLKKGEFRSFREKKITKKTNPEEGIRLNKFIAHSGICSRRQADVYIETGSVKVNGKIVNEMGYRIKPTDEIRFDNTIIKAEKPVYVLLNKPKNFITTTDDPQERKTVMELVKNATNARVYPVGRLDRMTMGVLLFTNDGAMSKKLTHPKHNVKKVYQVSLDKKLTYPDLQKIGEGIQLEDGFAAVDSVSYVQGQPKTEIGIELHLGKNRIVRRIFESLGYKVVKLDRVFFAGLTKKNLKRGEWRVLDKKEVDMLKMV